MHKVNWIISSVLAGSMLTLTTVGAVYACNGPGGKYQGGHGDKMTHMMQKLDLTPEQSEIIRNIKDEQVEKMSSKRTEMRSIRKALREQVRAEQYDAAKVRELADAKSKIMADMTVARIETMHRIRQQLTAEQVAKMEKMKRARMERKYD